MKKNEFYAAWPDYFDVVVDIDWTEPKAHKNLFSGEIPENETAYFYAIVSKFSGEWWPYYVGMTIRQTAAVRNQQPDHRAKLQKLHDSRPRQEFLITLGTPRFERGSAKSETIHAMEGLLIYGNWHQDMVNEKKVQTFTSVQHIHIRNVGWSEHLEPELAYGVFYRGRA